MKVFELLEEGKLYSKNIKRIYKGKPMYIIVADRKSFSHPYYVTDKKSLTAVQKDVINRLKKPIVNDSISLDPLVSQFKKAKGKGLQPVLIYLKPTITSSLKKAMNEDEAPQMVDIDVGEIAQIKATQKKNKSGLSKIRKVAKVIILKR